MFGRWAYCVFPLLFLSAPVGCQQVVNEAVRVRKVLPKTTWHKKCNWKAEDYFNDPRVVALCRAIEANDLADIDRLVAAGANVNAQGKGMMTPLLWAFPDNKLERFKRLLEHGANPNVIIESDFDTRGGMAPGMSVTHMATKTAFPGFFDAVFAHGGDPNLKQETVALGRGDTPIFTVIYSPAANKMERIRLLIAKGADLNHFNEGYDATPAIAASGQFDLVLMLLKAGADHKICQLRSNRRLMHVLLTRKSNIDHTESWTPQQKADYDALVEWLEAHGESLEEARKDEERWFSWSRQNGEYRRNMDAEVAARKAREAEEKKQPENAVEKADP